MKNSPQTLLNRKAKRKAWKESIDLSTVPRYKEKICKDCFELKPCRFMSCFNSRDGAPQYRSRCDPCHNALESKRAKDNRPRYNLKSLKIRKRKKAEYINYLGGKCYRCGYNNSTRALTFHHKDRREKRFSLAGHLDHAWEKIKPELDKCDLVCFNCHMELEEEYDKNRNKEPRSCISMVGNE